MNSSTAISVVKALVVAGAVAVTSALFGIPSLFAFGLGFLLQFLLPAILIRVHLGAQPRAPRVANHDLLMLVSVIGIFVVAQFLPTFATYAILCLASWVWAIYYVRYLGGEEALSLKE